MTRNHEHFKQLGREAFAAGQPASPVLNPEVRDAVATLPVGAGAATIFQSFSRGWHEANLEADR